MKRAAGDQPGRTGARVAVYRHELGRSSEPYIADQAEALEVGAVKLFGATRGPGPLTLPSWTLSDVPTSGLITPAFQLTRRSPILSRALARFRPDVVLAHFAQDAWRVAPSAHHVGAKLVAVCHGSDVLCADEYARQLGWSGRQLAGHWSDLAEQCSLFLPVGDWVAEGLRCRGIPESKIVRHHLGVALPPSKVLAEEKMPGRLAFAGRLVRNKGCDLAIDVIGRLRQSGFDAHLVVAGDGPERGALERQAADLGVADAVVFAGWLPPEGVERLLASSVAALVPSRAMRSGISEGFTLVPVQAQACGTPSIVTRVGGLAETVEHGVTGYAVDSEDVAALCAHAAELLQHPRLVRALGAAGRARVERDFDLGNQSRRLGLILAHLAKDNARPEVVDATQR